MAVTLGFGLLGFMDDYLKVTKQNTKGIVGSRKLIFQFLIAAAAGAVCIFVLSNSDGGSTDVAHSVPIPVPKRLHDPTWALDLFRLPPSLSSVHPMR